VITIDFYRHSFIFDASKLGMLSDAMEDYLKSIYRLQAEKGPPVSTSAVADTLEKTPATVTSMFETLTDRELLIYEKYEGVELTTEGETVALAVIRRHRLLESYLADQLGYKWSEVHGEADALEHHISEVFERRVAAALDDPQVDPHGDPIPTADLTPLSDAASGPLSACEEGEHVVVVRVRDRDPTELEYLDRVGIRPGTELTIVDVAPFGMITVAIGENDIDCGQTTMQTVSSSNISATADSTDHPSNTELLSAEQRISSDDNSNSLISTSIAESDNKPNGTTNVLTQSLPDDVAESVRIRSLDETANSSGIDSYAETHEQGNEPESDEVSNA
jgi:DtxR family Mn-dependent transcriptional regulator